MTKDRMADLLDKLEKCIDDPFVALHKDEAEQALSSFGIAVESEYYDKLAERMVSDSGWPKEWEITERGSSGYDLARLLEKYLG